MPRSSNQKLKLLYIAKFLREETDEAHGLTVAKIIQKLKEKDIIAERKAVYQDIEALRDFGMDIISCRDGHCNTYRLVSRDFELAELKLLVDSVQSAKFITEKKSRQLIEKLTLLAGRHEAGQLNRQVAITGRVKSMNEQILYNVDILHAAIRDRISIRFHYFQWNIQKQAVLRRDGDWYEVTPRMLVRDDDYYYLIAYEEASSSIRHYRVDKMQHIEKGTCPPAGEEHFEGIDAQSYTNRLFGMFGGSVVCVGLEATNDLAPVFIDRFGKDIMLLPKDANRFTVNLEVVPSSHFLGWVASLRGMVRITSPESVVADMRRLADRLQQAHAPDSNP